MVKIDIGLQIGKYLLISLKYLLEYFRISFWLMVVCIYLFQFVQKETFKTQGQLQRYTSSNSLSSGKKTSKWKKNAFILTPKLPLFFPSQKCLKPKAFSYTILKQSLNSKLPIKSKSKLYTYKAQ